VIFDLSVAIGFAVMVILIYRLLKAAALTETRLFDLNRRFVVIRDDFDRVQNKLNEQTMKNGILESKVYTSQKKIDGVEAEVDTRLDMHDRILAMHGTKLDKLIEERVDGRTDG
jgi:hypothetical protein